MTVAVVLLGCVGFRLQLLKENKAVEWLDLILKSCQLFVLQISVEPPMPWPLNLARIVAPLVAGYTALQALTELLANESQSFRLRFVRQHVVIAGLGRKGLRLARGFLQNGQAVVVIEQDEENDFVRQARDLGAAVLISDASEPDMLQKARVGRALHLFALCGDDGVNAGVAAMQSLTACFAMMDSFARQGRPMDAQMRALYEQLKPQFPQP